MRAAWGGGVPCTRPPVVSLERRKSAKKKENTLQTAESTTYAGDPSSDPACGHPPHQAQRVHPKRTASPDPERGNWSRGSVSTLAGRGCNSSPCGLRSLRTSTHTRSSQIHDSAQGPSRVDSPADEEAGEMWQCYSRQALAQGTVPLFVQWHSRSWHALALSRPLSAVSAPRAANALAWCTLRWSACNDQMRLQPVAHLDGEQG